MFEFGLAGKTQTDLMSDDGMEMLESELGAMRAVFPGVDDAMSTVDAMVAQGDGPGAAMVMGGTAVVLLLLRIAHNFGTPYVETHNKKLQSKIELDAEERRAAIEINKEERQAEIRQKFGES